MSVSADLTDVTLVSEDTLAIKDTDENDEDNGDEGDENDNPCSKTDWSEAEGRARIADDYALGGGLAISDDHDDDHHHHGDHDDNL